MSAIEERIDANAVAPDSVEVIEAYRSWALDSGSLTSSYNGIAWKPGEPLHAECRGGIGTRYEVALVRHGASREKIAEEIYEHNQLQGRYASMYIPPRVGLISMLQIPAVEPPPGYGYAIRPIDHLAPDEGCTCGIYSGTTLAVCPPGEVRGKVKLWGKIIPGEKGYRAEYAYPSEFIVRASLAEHPALLAFGVPITVADDMPPVGDVMTFGLTVGPPEPRSKLERGLKRAIVFNVAACILNAGFVVVLHFLRWL